VKANYEFLFQEWHMKILRYTNFAVTVIVLGHILSIVGLCLVANFTTRTLLNGVVCQEERQTDFDGYCQSCHDDIAARNVRDGSK
jgi:dihydroxyacetone kinase